MPIRFLFPIIIGAVLLFGLRAAEQNQVEEKQNPQVIETPAPKEVIESSKPTPVLKPAAIKPVTPKPVAAPKPAPTITPQTPGLTSYESELLVLINGYRANRGLRSISANTALYNLAKEHSDDMYTRKNLNHDGFDDRFARAKRMECVENVGWNYLTPSDQLKGWQNSPQHNEALLNAQITTAGIAKSGTYVTFFACQ